MWETYRLAMRSEPLTRNIRRLFLCRFLPERVLAVAALGARLARRQPAIPGDGEVYRALRSDEDPSQGLTPKDPGANETLDRHVRFGSQPWYPGSQFISTTWDEAIARGVFGSGGERIVRIALDRVSAPVFDLDNEDCRMDVLSNPVARAFAKAAREVVIEGNIPPEAITLLP